MNTPEYAHKQSGTLKKHWKNYYSRSKKVPECEKEIAL